MGTSLNRDGQPIEPFNAHRVHERTVDEMLGICKGILACGQVLPKQAEFLNAWLLQNPETASVWPAAQLAARLHRVFADGRIHPEELADLQELLQMVTGERPGLPAGVRKTTALPLDDPAPPVNFTGQLFCFTGKFAHGTRNACESEASARGARCQGQPTLETSFLVIGVLGSRDWIHTAHGRKIEFVVEARERGKARTAIVSEEHWLKFL